MFSGICPCSPCDRASPRASVSTLGSMTRRPRVWVWGPWASGSPAPGHGQHKIQLRRREARGGSEQLTRSRAGASHPRGCGSRTPEPRPVSQLRSRTPSLHSSCQEEIGVRCAAMACLGWARAAATAAARAQLPGARSRVWPSSERLPSCCGCCCRRCRSRRGEAAAAAPGRLQGLLLPRLRAPARGRGTPSLFPSLQLTSPCLWPAPPRAARLSQVRSWEVAASLPASLLPPSRVLSVALSSPRGAGAG